MENIVGQLENGKILVSDGAMGTMLLEKGLKPGQCPESFNISRIEVLEEIARLYFEAGADIIQTNTFGASPLKLSLYSLDDKTQIINQRAVQVVKNAVGDKAYISASCGPTGKLLKPFGDTGPEKVLNGYAMQIKALVEAGADIICIETMTDLTEATLAIKAAKTVSSSIPVMATMTFDHTPRGFYTIMGVSIEKAAEGLKDAGADVIGSNCGNGIENMVAIAREFGKCSKLPLIIQSNAGLPQMKEGKTTYGETPEFMAGKVRELIAAGVSIIGGCCGTTPEHITAFRKAVDSYQRPA